jgi:hypothetical protein
MKLSALVAAFCAALTLAAAILPAAAPWEQHGRLRVSAEGHTLQVECEPVQKPCCSKNKGPYIQ